MNNTNLIIAFLSELIIRLKSKSPRFFVILQYIGIAAFVITGLPELLSFFGITLPASLSVFASKAIAAASLVFSVLTKLAVVDTANLPFSNSDKK